MLQILDLKPTPYALNPYPQLETQGPISKVRVGELGRVLHACDGGNYELVAYCFLGKGIRGYLIQGFPNSVLRTGKVGCVISMSSVYILV